MKIIKNAIQCKNCGDIIESTSVHDFKFCKCKSCFVDGGHSYLRRGAKNLDKMEAGRAHGFNRGVKGRGSEMNAMNLKKSH